MTEPPSGDAPFDVLAIVIVYSHVPLKSYVSLAAITLLVPVGTIDGAEMDAPDGKGDDSSGGFGQLAALATGPVGRSIGWGIEPDATREATRREACVADPAATAEMPQNAVDPPTRMLSPQPIARNLGQAVQVKAFPSQGLLAEVDSSSYEPPNSDIPITGISELVIKGQHPGALLGPDRPRHDPTSPTP